jgi:hypothetical protein
MICVYIYYNIYYIIFYIYRYKIHSLGLERSPQTSSIFTLSLFDWRCEAVVGHWGLFSRARLSAISGVPATSPVEQWSATPTSRVSRHRQGPTGDVLNTFAMQGHPKVTHGRWRCAWCWAVLTCGIAQILETEHLGTYEKQIVCILRKIQESSLTPLGFNMFHPPNSQPRACYPPRQIVYPQCLAVLALLLRPAVGSPVITS